MEMGSLKIIIFSLQKKLTIHTTAVRMHYLLVAQMLEEVPKYFQGLYSNAFTLRGHELVDYPGIGKSSESWKEHLVFTE